MKSPNDTARRCSLRPHSGFLFLTCLFAFTQWAEAQQETALDAFLGDDAPAILFEVNSLSLEKYSGGFGLLYSISDSFHWTFVLSPSLRRSSIDKRYDQGLLQSEYRSYGLGITAAPHWILKSDGDFCLTAGPMLGYSFESWKEETITDEMYVHRRVEHSMRVGLEAGAGYALSPSLLLHLQYRLQGLGSWTFSDGSVSRSSRWHIDTIGLLSLGVRL